MVWLPEFPFWLAYRQRFVRTGGLNGCYGKSLGVVGLPCRQECSWAGVVEESRQVFYRSARSCHRFLEKSPAAIKTGQKTADFGLPCLWFRPIISETNSAQSCCPLKYPSGKYRFSTANHQGNTAADLENHLPQLQNRLKMDFLNLTVDTQTFRQVKVAK